MIHKFFNKIPAKTLQYIAEDFRKMGTIAGVGLIGFVLAKDNIDEIEAFVLFTVGITFWLLGLLLNILAILLH
ncbi:hypothetical protein BTV20_02410 [Histophilus somni]|uniref:Uncharacterized protein n=1 Tax=Histophilus somni TaxID=731 RepID=A0A9Q7E5P9_HISSO|nr:hypothetical protein [Histophilus somni]ARU64436.1 hypothetical protein BTV18_02410 [Histophilus somni]ARU66223.1 hypothetical protein BTV19_02405 [Histophilus somni]ARU68097.1 hypothetical protein BTV16_02410 [Histophilus somni]ARU69978.1 hypothetical protein BTV20_02410 [Histophilus somni]ARU71852.1 hypothetical protein BTV17_02405 [Histophilus somni]